MANSKNRRQTPAQRAAQRRAAAPAPGAREAATRVISNESGSITTHGTPQELPYADEDVFDLDAVAHEAAGERFRFKTGIGPERRVWELRTPEEVDWKENSTLTERATGREDLRPVLRLLLGEDQYEDFLDLTISVGQVAEVLKQWRAWHGIELGE